MTVKLIEISENNDFKVFDDKFQNQHGLKEGKPFQFAKKEKKKIPIIIEKNAKEKKQIKTEWSNYYIGMDWLIEKELAISVVPKLDKNQEGKTDFLTMFFSCLEDPEVSKHTNKLYDIDFEKPVIEIEGKDDSLTPLLIIHYLKTLKRLVRKGLKKSYYPISKNLNSRIKGKINISLTLKERFKSKPLYHHCHYDEFGVNNIENRFLKKALLFCQRAMAVYQKESSHKESWYKDTQHFFNYCLPAFAEVDEKIEIHELKHFRRSAFYLEYGEALRLAKLILKRFGYNIKSIDAQKKIIKVPPFWIDMANLFELYVLKLLKKKYDNIIYHENGNYGETDFLYKGSEKIIIDAKYKKKYGNGKYEIDDIRQLSGYARDIGVLEKLEIKEDKENKVIDCLIIYPNQENGEDSISLDEYKEKEKEKINGFTQFYKIGIKLPV